MFTQDAQYDLSVHFLDADRTIFNNQYRYNRDTILASQYSEAANVIVSNFFLLADIAKSINQVGQGQIESTSLRQSPHFDQYAAFDFCKTATFSATLVTLHEELQRLTQDRCHLETYLVWDSCALQEAGKGFKLAQEKDRCPLTCAIDETKISIFYAKIQRLANKYPGKKIKITAWDDLVPALDGLEIFFETNKKWCIPENVTLHFVQHGCQDGIFYPRKTIKGSGKPNRFYEATIREFYKSQQYKNIEQNQFKDMHLQGIYGYMLEDLHREACSFSEMLCKEDVDDLRQISYEEYYCDMLKCFNSVSKVENLLFFRMLLRTIPNAINCFTTKSILDFYQRNKKMPLAQLVDVLLDKIQKASTREEVHEVIDALCEKQYQPLLHDRRGMIKWSLKNSTWHDKPVSATFDHLVKVAKCKILLLLQGQECEVGQVANERDITFLQAHRRGSGKHSSYAHSFYLFNRLKYFKPDPGVSQEVNGAIKKHSQLIRKRHGLM